MRAKSLQSYPTLREPMDCSPPGSSVHGILQARTLEQVAIFLLQRLFLTQESNPHLLCLLHWQADSLLVEPSGKPSCPAEARTDSGKQSRMSSISITGHLHDQITCKFSSFIVFNGEAYIRLY